jgi:hypothetical protein
MIERSGFFIGGEKYCYNKINERFARLGFKFDSNLCKPKRMSFCNSFNPNINYSTMR